MTLDRVAALIAPSDTSATLRRIDVPSPEMEFRCSTPQRELGDLVALRVFRVGRHAGEHGLHRFLLGRFWPIRVRARTRVTSPVIQHFGHVDDVPADAPDAFDGVPVVAPLETRVAVQAEVHRRRALDAQGVPDVGACKMQDWIPVGPQERVTVPVTVEDVLVRVDEVGKVLRCSHRRQDLKRVRREEIVGIDRNQVVAGALCEACSHRSQDPHLGSPCSADVTGRDQRVDQLPEICRYLTVDPDDPFERRDRLVGQTGPQFGEQAGVGPGVHRRDHAQRRGGGRSGESLGPRFGSRSGANRDT